MRREAAQERAAPLVPVVEPAGGEVIGGCRSEPHCEDQEGGRSHGSAGFRQYVYRFAKRHFSGDIYGRMRTLRNATGPWSACNSSGPLATSCFVQLLPVGHCSSALS